MKIHREGQMRSREQYARDLFSENSFGNSGSLDDVSNLLVKMRNELKNYLDKKNLTLQKSISPNLLNLLLRGEYFFSAQPVNDLYEKSNIASSQRILAKYRLAKGEISNKDIVDKATADSSKATGDYFDAYDGLDDKFQHVRMNSTEIINLGECAEIVRLLGGMSREEIEQSGIIHGLTRQFGLRDAVMKILNIE